MTKVVFNNCFGGFSISDEAKELAMSIAPEGSPWLEKGLSRYLPSVPRHDETLVKVVEMLGDKAYGRFSDLDIVELSGDRYIIEEYDGAETVVEPEDIAWVFV